MTEAPDNFLVDYSDIYSGECEQSSIYGRCPSPFLKFAHPEKIHQKQIQ